MRDSFNPSLLGGNQQEFRSGFGGPKTISGVSGFQPNVKRENINRNRDNTDFSELLGNTSRPINRVIPNQQQTASFAEIANILNDIKGLIQKLVDNTIASNRTNNIETILTDHLTRTEFVFDLNNKTLDFIRKDNLSYLDFQKKSLEIFYINYLERFTKTFDFAKFRLEANLEKVASKYNIPVSLLNMYTQTSAQIMSKNAKYGPEALNVIFLSNIYELFRHFVVDFNAFATRTDKTDLTDDLFNATKRSFSKTATDSLLKGIQKIPLVGGITAGALTSIPGLIDGLSKFFRREEAKNKLASKYASKKTPEMRTADAVSLLPQLTETQNAILSGILDVQQNMYEQNNQLLTALTGSSHTYTQRQTTDQRTYVAELGEFLTATELADYKTNRNKAVREDLDKGFRGFLGKKFSFSKRARNRQAAEIIAEIENKNAFNREGRGAEYNAIGSHFVKYSPKGTDTVATTLPMGSAVIPKQAVNAYPEAKKLGQTVPFTTVSKPTIGVVPNTHVGAMVTPGEVIVPPQIAQSNPKLINSLITDGRKRQGINVYSGGILYPDYYVIGGIAQKVKAVKESAVNKISQHETVSKVKSKIDEYDQVSLKDLIGEPTGSKIEETYLSRFVPKYLRDIAIELYNSDKYISSFIQGKKNKAKEEIVDELINELFQQLVFLTPVLGPIISLTTKLSKDYKKVKSPEASLKENLTNFVKSTSGTKVAEYAGGVTGGLTGIPLGSVLGKQVYNIGKDSAVKIHKLGREAGYWEQGGYAIPPHYLKQGIKSIPGKYSVPATGSLNLQTPITQNINVSSSSNDNYFELKDTIVSAINDSSIKTIQEDFSKFKEKYLTTLDLRYKASTYQQVKRALDNSQLGLKAKNDNVLTLHERLAANRDKLQTPATSNMPVIPLSVQKEKNLPQEKKEKGWLSKVIDFITGAAVHIGMLSLLSPILIPLFKGIMNALFGEKFIQGVSDWTPTFIKEMFDTDKNGPLDLMFNTFKLALGAAIAGPIVFALMKKSAVSLLSSLGGFIFKDLLWKKAIVPIFSKIGSAIKFSSFSLKLGELFGSILNGFSKIKNLFPSDPGFLAKIGLPKLLGGFFGFIFDGIVGAVKGFKEGGIWGMIKGGLKGALTSDSIGGNAFKYAMLGIPFGPIGMIGGALLGSAVQFIFDNWEGIKSGKVFADIWESISSTVGGLAKDLWQWVKDNVFESIRKTLAEVPALGSFFKTTEEKLKEKAQEATVKLPQVAAESNVLKTQTSDAYTALNVLKTEKDKLRKKHGDSPAWWDMFTKETEGQEQASNLEDQIDILQNIYDKLRLEESRKFKERSDLIVAGGKTNYDLNKVMPADLVPLYGDDKELSKREQFFKNTEENRKKLATGISSDAEHQNRLSEFEEKLRKDSQETYDSYSSPISIDNPPTAVQAKQEEGMFSSVFSFMNSLIQSNEELLNEKVREQKLIKELISRKQIEYDQQNIAANEYRSKVGTSAWYEFDTEEQNKADDMEAEVESRKEELDNLRNKLYKLEKDIVGLELSKESNQLTTSPITTESIDIAGVRKGGGRGKTGETYVAAEGGVPEVFIPDDGSSFDFLTSPQLYKVVKDGVFVPLDEYLQSDNGIKFVFNPEVWEKLKGKASELTTNGIEALKATPDQIQQLASTVTQQGSQMLGTAGDMARQASEQFGQTVKSGIETTKSVFNPNKTIEKEILDKLQNNVHIIRLYKTKDGIIFVRFQDDTDYVVYSNGMPIVFSKLDAVIKNDKDKKYDEFKDIKEDDPEKDKKRKDIEKEQDETVKKELEEQNPIGSAISKFSDTMTSGLTNAMKFFGQGLDPETEKAMKDMTNRVLQNPFESAGDAARGASDLAAQNIGPLLNKAQNAATEGLYSFMYGSKYKKDWTFGGEENKKKFFEQLQGSNPEDLTANLQKYAEKSNNYQNWYNNYRGTEFDDGFNADMTYSAKPKLPSIPQGFPSISVSTGPSYNRPEHTNFASITSQQSTPTTTTETPTLPTSQKSESALFIAGMPVIKGQELSNIQMVAIQTGLSMGNKYPDYVIEQYNKQAGLTTQQTKPVTATETPTLPTQSKYQTTDEISKFSSRDEDPSFKEPPQKINGQEAIANEPFIKGNPLSEKQLAKISYLLNSNYANIDNFSQDLIDQYNKQVSESATSQQSAPTTATDTPKLPSQNAIDYGQVSYDPSSGEIPDLTKLKLKPGEHKLPGGIEGKVYEPLIQAYLEQTGNANKTGLIKEAHNKAAWMKITSLIASGQIKIPGIDVSSVQSQLSSGIETPISSSTTTDLILKQTESEQTKKGIRNTELELIDRLDLDEVPTKLYSPKDGQYFIKFADGAQYLVDSTLMSEAYNKIKSKINDPKKSTYSDAQKSSAQSPANAPTGSPGTDTPESTGDPVKDAQNKFMSGLQKLADQQKAMQQATGVSAPVSSTSGGNLGSTTSAVPAPLSSTSGGNLGSTSGSNIPSPTTGLQTGNELVTIKTKSGKTAKVAAKYAANFQGFINELEATGYEIKVLGGYANRNAVGSQKKSYHAFGAAIDINPATNPYGKEFKTDMPSNTGQIAAKYGLGWGGNWKNVKDAMHFSIAKSEGGSVAIDRGSDPGITSDKSSSSSYTPAPSPANTGAIPPAATNVDTSNLSQPTGSSSSGGLGSTTGGNVPAPISSTSGGGLGSTTGGNVPTPMSNVGSSFMSGLSSMAGGNISSQLSSAGSSFISGLGATFGGNVPAPMFSTSSGGLGATFGGSIPTPMSSTSAGGLGSTTGGNVPAPMSGTSGGGLGGKVTTNTPVSTKQSGMMKQVYDSFKNAGFSDNQARALTAEVGRENDFNAKNVFGSHIDPKNNAVNLGFFSWQGSRGKKLQQYLTERGLIQDGKIVQSQESLNAMAQFSKQEMESGGYKGMDKFLNNPNVDRDTASQILGKKYIKWRHDDPAYAHHHAKRNKYYDQLGGFATQIDPKQSNAPGSMPGSNVAGTPGSMPGSNVAGAPGSMPGSMPGSNVAGAPGNMPGSNVAGAPGSMPGQIQTVPAVDSSQAYSNQLGGKRVSSEFGMRTHPKTGERKMHKGIDIAGPKGTPIKMPGSMKPGVVTFSGVQRGYGNIVEVKHDDGTTTRYAHMSENSVKVGQKVDSNTQLGKMGSTGVSTGSHLHFEVRDEKGNPVDPNQHLAKVAREQGIPPQTAQQQIAQQSKPTTGITNPPATNSPTVDPSKQSDPSTWQMPGQQVAANAPITGTNDVQIDFDKMQADMNNGNLPMFASTTNGVSDVTNLNDPNAMTRGFDSSTPKGGSTPKGILPDIQKQSREETLANIRKQNGVESTTGGKMPTDYERRQEEANKIAKKYGVESSLASNKTDAQRRQEFMNGTDGSRIKGIQTSNVKQEYPTANDAINAGFAEGAKETKPTTGTTTPQVLSTQEARNKIVSKLQDPNLSEEERAKWASSIPALNEADRRMEEAKQSKPETGVTSPPSKEDVDLESQLQTTVNEAQTENQLQDAVNIPSPTGTSSGPPSSVSSESTGSGTTQQPSYNEQPTSQQMQQPQQPSNPLESAAQGFLSTLQGLMGMSGMPGMSGNMFGGQMMGGFNKPNIMSPFQSLTGAGANLMGQGFNAISQGVNNLFSGGSEIALTPPQAQFDVQNATSSTIQTAAETDMMRSDMVGQAVSGSLAQDSSGMVDPGSLSPDSELQPRHYPTNLSGGGSGFSKDDMTTTPVDPLGDDIALRLFNLLSPSLFYSAKNQAMETKQNNYIENIFI